MTDFRVLELEDELKIESCPKCGNTEFYVIRDYGYIVNTESDLVDEAKLEDIKEVECTKCGWKKKVKPAIKVFRVPAEELGAETVKCGGCNWRVSQLFVLAKNEEEAIELIKKGEAGLCGDCFGELLADLAEKGLGF